MATKLVKNYLMAIVAMVMVVGFSAFKVAENTQEKVSNGYIPWYFKGGDETTPGDYTDDEMEAPDCSGPSQVICEILAPEDEHSSGVPDLDAPSDPNDEGSPKIWELILQAKNNPGVTNDSVLSFREE